MADINQAPPVAVQPVQPVQQREQLVPQQNVQQNLPPGLQRLFNNDDQDNNAPYRPPTANKSPLAQRVDDDRRNQTKTKPAYNKNKAKKGNK